MLLTASHRICARDVVTSTQFNRSTPVASAPVARSVGSHKRAVTVMAIAGGQQEEKRVLVPIANGTEEMEAVIVIDVLRRAGALVTVASVEESAEVVCSRGVKLVADKLINECSSRSFDLIACPGGMPGAERLRDCAVLEDMVRTQRDAGRKYAAICATPYVFFQSKGLLDNRAATAHPAFSDGLKDQRKVLDRVVVDGPLTTSRGPGTAFEFAFCLVKQLYGEDKARQVAGPMVMYPHHV